MHRNTLTIIDESRRKQRTADLRTIMELRKKLKECDCTKTRCDSKECLATKKRKWVSGDPLMSWFEFPLAHYATAKERGVTMRQGESENTITFQCWGFEVVLMDDGTYFLNDTSGG